MNLFRDFTDLLLVMAGAASFVIATIMYAIARMLTPRDRR
jgi:hypothetical protein